MNKDIILLSKDEYKKFNNLYNDFKKYIELTTGLTLSKEEVVELTSNKYVIDIMVKNIFEYGLLELEKYDFINIQMDINKIKYCIILRYFSLKMKQFLIIKNNFTFIENLHLISQMNNLKVVYFTENELNLIKKNNNLSYIALKEFNLRIPNNMKIII